MANEDVLIQVGANISGADSKLGQLNRAISDLGDTAHGAERKSGGFFSSLFGNAGKIAGLVGVAGLGGVALGFGKVATEGLGFNNSMEKVTAQLNAFTKDGAKTAEILEMIKDRASKTPFEFEEMAKATSSLMSSAKQADKPLVDLVQTAEILAASNPAEGLEGAAFALREAVSGDFTSIIERFNLPRTAINKLKEEGVPALEIVSRTMKDMGYDVDLVANLANTAEGRFSTFKDTITNVAGVITKPLFDAFSSGLGGVNTMLEENKPQIEAFATAVGQGLASALQALPGIFSAIGSVVGPVIEVIGSLVQYFQMILETGDPLNDFLTHLPEPLQPLIQFVGQLVAAWQAFFNTLSSGGSIFDAFAGLLGDTVAGVADFAGNVLQMIGDALPGILAKLGEWGMAFVNWLLPQLPGWIAAAAEFLGSMLSWIFENAGKILDKLGEWGKAFVDWLAPRLPGWLEEAGKFLAKALEWIVTTALPKIITKLAEWGKAFIDWIGPRIGPMLIELGKILLAVGQWLITVALPAIVSKLGEWGQAFLDWVGRDVLPFIGAKLGELATAIWTWITNTAKDVVKKVGEIGKGIIDGIAAGIKGAWDGFINWMASLIRDALPQWLKDWLGIKSPSTITAAMGRDLIRGFIVGIGDEFPGVSDAFRQGFQNVFGELNADNATWGKALNFREIIKGGFGLGSGANNVFGELAANVDQMAVPALDRFETATADAATTMTDTLGAQFDKDDKGSMLGKWNEGFDKMFQHIQQAWGPMTDLQIRFWLIRWRGLFRDFVEDINEMWANLPDLAGAPVGAGGGGGGGGGGAGSPGLNRFAYAGNRPTQIYVTLDGREIGRALSYDVRRMTR